MNRQNTSESASLADLIAAARAAQAARAAARAALAGEPDALTLMADPLINLKQVMSIVGLSRSPIYVRLARKEFPAPVRLSSKAVRWRLSTVLAWMDALSGEPPAAGGSK